VSAAAAPAEAEADAALELLVRNQTARGWSGPWLLAVRLLFGAALIGLWYLVDVIWPGQKLTISNPTDVASTLRQWMDSGVLWSSSLVTLKETAFSLLIGVAGGMFVGIVLGLLPKVGRVVEPYVMALYSLPKLALTPLFIIWFGIGVEMKVALGTVLVFFVLFLNSMAGIRDVDDSLRDALRLCGASRLEVLRKVTLPSASPYVLLGIKMAVPYALLGAVVGELMAATNGLGYLISNASSQYDTAGVFAGLIVLIILAVILNQLAEWLERRALRWRKPSR
jgi:NitT/TauT family transport system permease protein